jgi:hypothetical protein
VIRVAKKNHSRNFGSLDIVRIIITSGGCRMRVRGAKTMEMLICMNI